MAGTTTGLPTGPSEHIHRPTILLTRPPTILPIPREAPVFQVAPVAILAVAAADQVQEEVVVVAAGRHAARQGL